MVNVGVVGAAGKMGKTLISLISASDELRLAAAIEQPGHESLGKDAGELAGVGAQNVLVSDDLGSSFDEVESFSTTGKAVGVSGYVDNSGNVVLIYVRSSDGALLYGRKSSPRGSFASDPSYNNVLNSNAGAEVKRLGEMVRTIGHTVMFLNPWDQAGALARAWVLKMITKLT